VSKAPQPVGPARYGLQRVEAGVYLHRSGRYILQTDGWEGPRGGSFSLWEEATWEEPGAFTVDSGGGTRTLRQKAAELDKEFGADSEEGERS
jgi:hypothetical protein